MADVFHATADRRIAVYLQESEKRFLEDLLLLLETVGSKPDDPGERRLNIPAYIGDPEGADAANRSIDERLSERRSADRGIMQQVLDSPTPAVVELDGAHALLRVINEARLVLAARLGVEVPSDYEDLDVGATVALHLLGIWIEDLVEELGRSLR